MIDQPLKVIYRNYQFIFFGQLEQHIQDILEECKDKSFLQFISEYSYTEYVEPLIKKFGKEWFNCIWTSDNLITILQLIIQDQIDNNLMQILGSQNKYNMMLQNTKGYIPIFQAYINKVVYRKITNKMYNDTFQQHINYQLQNKQTGGKYDSDDEFSFDLGDEHIELGQDEVDPFEQLNFYDEQQYEVVNDKPDEQESGNNIFLEMLNNEQYGLQEEQQKFFWNVSNNTKQLINIYIYDTFVNNDDSIQYIKHKISSFITYNKQYFDPDMMYIYIKYQDQNKQTQHIPLTNELLYCRDFVPELPIVIDPQTIGELLKSDDEKYLYFIKYNWNFLKQSIKDTYVLQFYNDFNIYNEVYLDYLVDNVNVMDMSIPQNQFYNKFVSIYYPQCTSHKYLSIVGFKYPVSTEKHIYIDKKDMNSNVTQYLNQIYKENVLSDILDKYDGKHIDQSRISIIQAIVNCQLTYEQNQNQKLEKWQIDAINQQINTYKKRDIYLTKATGISKQLDLRKIFDDFVTNHKYVFVYYKENINKQPLFKCNSQFFDDVINNLQIYNTTQQQNAFLDKFYKWFDINSNGLIFKIRQDDNIGQYIQVHIYEDGQIEYKIQWKKVHFKNLQHIDQSQMYISELVERINQQSDTMIDVPITQDFQLQYINYIYSYNNKFNQDINHDELQYFFNYFSIFFLVLSDKKFQHKKNYVISKFKNVDNIVNLINSKDFQNVIKQQREQALLNNQGSDGHDKRYGTYIRSKKINKYVDINKINNKILFIMKNFQYNEQQLINIINHFFGISLDTAKKMIEEIKVKHQSQLHVNNKDQQQKLDYKFNIPSLFIQGTNIDIQGKQRDNYIIRFSGVKNVRQFQKLTMMIHTILELYFLIFKVKDPEYQHILDTLIKINIVPTQSTYSPDLEQQQINEQIETENKSQKIAKGLLHFKPNRGQNQWTRQCQNSDGKIRRPKDYNSVDELMKQGYYFDKATGYYVKEYIDSNGQKQLYYSVQIKGDGIHYTCSEEVNGEYQYIGFLTKNKTPTGLCMPCCFKINQTDQTKRNDQIYNNFWECMQNNQVDVNDQFENPNEQYDQVQNMENILNKLMIQQREFYSRIQTFHNDSQFIYILKNNKNKQPYRIIYLPYILDLFLNNCNGYVLNQKNNQLINTDDYFLKVGIDTVINNSYIDSLCMILQISKVQFIQKIEQFLDKYPYMFRFSKQQGQFNSIQQFAQYLLFQQEIDYRLIHEIIQLPNVFSDKYRIQIIIMDLVKRVNSIEQDDTSNKISIDGNQLTMYDLDYYESQYDTKYILMLREDKQYFYPIVSVQKYQGKDLRIQYTFDQPNYSKLIDTIKKVMDNQDNGSVYSKYHMFGLGSVIQYQVSNQDLDILYYYIIDGYLVPQKNNYLIYDIPVVPIQDIDIMEPIDIDSEKFITSTGIQQLDALVQKYDTFLRSKLNMYVLGLNYQHQIENGWLRINSLKIGSLKDQYDNSHLQVFNNDFFIDPKQTKYQCFYFHLYNDLFKKDIGLFGMTTQNVQIIETNKKKFIFELYQYFKLEINNFLVNQHNQNYLNTLIQVYYEIQTDMIQEQQILYLKLFIYKLLSQDMYQKYLTIVQKDLSNKKQYYKINVLEQRDLMSDRFEMVQFINRDFQGYVVTNNRLICSVDNASNGNAVCEKGKLVMTNDILIDSVNKLSSELVINEVNLFELINKNNEFFINDIVDTQIFKQFDNQMVIKNLVDNIFDKTNNVFVSKMQQQINVQQQKYQQLINDQQNLWNPYIERSSGVIIQNVNIVYGHIRAFINNYFGIIDEGYQSIFQQQQLYIFRGQIYNWIIKNQQLFDQINQYQYDKRATSQYMDYVEYLNNLLTQYDIDTGILDLQILCLITNKSVLLYLNNIKWIYINKDSTLEEPGDELPNIDNPSNIFKINYQMQTDNIFDQPKLIQSVVNAQ